MKIKVGDVVIVNSNVFPNSADPDDTKWRGAKGVVMWVENNHYEVESDDLQDWSVFTESQIAAQQPAQEDKSFMPPTGLV